MPLRHQRGAFPALTNQMKTAKFLQMPCEFVRWVCFCALRESWLGASRIWASRIGGLRRDTCWGETRSDASSCVFAAAPGRPVECSAGADYRVTRDHVASSTIQNQVRPDQGRSERVIIDGHLQLPPATAGARIRFRFPASATPRQLGFTWNYENSKLSESR